MANGIQASLLESFKEVAGGLTTNVQGIISRIAATTAAQISSEGQSAGSGTSNQQNGGHGAMSIATTVLESGLGLVPLVAGLIGLFGGHDSENLPPLTKYAMPERLRFETVNTNAGVASADYDQFGMPRLAERHASSDADGRTQQAESSDNARTAQININVQAMDSKSFLDHSNEIAQAVRAAMLNLSSINDVVNDL